jgi:hypothetical protein
VQRPLDHGIAEELKRTTAPVERSAGVQNGKD